MLELLCIEQVITFFGYAIFTLAIFSKIACSVSKFYCNYTVQLNYNVIDNASISRLKVVYDLLHELLRKRSVSVLLAHVLNLQ